MSEQHRRERPFALGYDEIGLHRAALRTVVSNIVQRAIGEFLDDLVGPAQRLLGVVIEKMGGRIRLGGGFGLCLRSGQRCSQEQNQSTSEISHRALR